MLVGFWWFPLGFNPLKVTLFADLRTAQKGDCLRKASSLGPHCRGADLHKVLELKMAGSFSGAFNCVGRVFRGVFDHVWSNFY